MDHIPVNMLGQIFELIDQVGKIIKVGIFANTEERIIVENLSEGLYLLKINDSRQETFQILKK
jgi:uncharacterized surface anchored protein